MGQSKLTERVQAAFTSEINRLVPHVNIEFVHIKDIQGYDELEKVVRRYEGEKDCIVLLRSNGAKWLSRNKTSIPTFIGATNNPETIGAVYDMQNPRGNVTGVTYFLPHRTQFSIFKSILPDMRSVLLLLQAGHASSLVDRIGTMAACKNLGLQYFEIECKREQDSIEAVRQYRDKVSAIIIGSNNINIENASDIIKAAGGCPVLAYTDSPVKSGALVGYVPDDEKRGRLLAESVYAVMVKKQPIRNIPVKTDPNPKFLLNAEASDRLGLKLSYEIVRYAEIIE